MNERMVGIKVAITRFVSVDPQPGVVECEFLDAFNRRWTFFDKTAIFSADHLDAETMYPKEGVIACEIVSRRVNSTGQETVVIRKGIGVSSPLRGPRGSKFFQVPWSNGSGEARFISSGTVMAEWVHRSEPPP